MAREEAWSKTGGAREGDMYEGMAKEGRGLVLKGGVCKKVGP